MNIHKFNTKPIFKPTKTIKWMIPNETRQYVKKVNITTWEIFSQEDIILKPKEVKFIMLGIGFIISEGVVLTFLSDSLTKKRISLQNGVYLTDTLNIIGVEGTGAVLLSTGVGAPFAVALGISGVVTGAVSLIGNIFSKKATTKAEKHLKIKTLAMAKLDTIASHISKALTDDFISNEEFNLIMEEMNKYKALKEDIRNNTKKKLKTEEEESLIEKGRQEARESFRKLVEKNHGGPLAY